MRLIIPVAIIALLLSLPCPAVEAHNGTATTQATVTSEDNGTSAKAATKTKAKPVTAKARDKSVLDADVLDSPLSYFKEAFTSEEDNNSSDSPTVVNTVKALVATLLSTVL